MSNPKPGALRPFKPINFARYTLLMPIAKGGMGEVFLAQMSGAGGFEKQIVIKKILPELAKDKDFVDRFLTEAKLLVQLHHGSIAQILDMGVEDGSYYIAMELVDGKDLRRILQKAKEQNNRLPVGLCLHIIIRILDALAYAHRKTLTDGSELNLVHRDISPQNILVSYEGDVKLIDFGLAKSSTAQSNQAQSGPVVGKIFYMAPEQTANQGVDKRCDLYATGICLWEMLSGKNPFDTGESALMTMHRVANPEVPSIRTLRPELPEALDEFLQKAIEPDPEERFASAEEMRGALTGVLMSIDPMAGPESLATYMMEMFQADYDRERKNIEAVRNIAPKPRSTATQSTDVKSQEGQSDATGNFEKPELPEETGLQRKSLEEDTGRRSCTVGETRRISSDQLMAFFAKRDAQLASEESGEAKRKNASNRTSDRMRVMRSASVKIADPETSSSSAKTAVPTPVSEGRKSRKSSLADFSMETENAHNQRRRVSTNPKSVQDKKPPREKPAKKSEPREIQENVGQEPKTLPGIEDSPLKTPSSETPEPTTLVSQKSSTKALVAGVMGFIFVIAIALVFYGISTGKLLGANSNETPKVAQPSTLPPLPAPPQLPVAAQTSEGESQKNPTKTSAREKKASASTRVKKENRAQALLRKNAPPASFADVKYVYETLSRDLNALKEQHGCENLAMMCEFHAGLAKPLRELEIDSAKKLPPESLPRKRHLFWNNLKLLNHSLQEQQDKLESK